MGRNCSRMVCRRDKEKPNIVVAEDTVNMRKWRGLSQSEMHLCWRKVEEEVWDKYKVEERSGEAFGAPLEWTRIRKNKRYRIRKW